MYPNKSPLSSTPRPLNPNPSHITHKWHAKNPQQKQQQQQQQQQTKQQQIYALDARSELCRLELNTKQQGIQRKVTFVLQNNKSVSLATSIFRQHRKSHFR
jgi:hypothetical protein